MISITVRLISNTMDFQCSSLARGAYPMLSLCSINRQTLSATFNHLRARL
jgi:hypothetical protein